MGPGSALLQVSWVTRSRVTRAGNCASTRPLIEPKSRLLRVTGRVPQERWDCDILEEEGEKRFKSLAEEIKQACAAQKGVSWN